MNLSFSKRAARAALRVLCACLAIAAASCRSDEPADPGRPRTVLVYMVANNNLAPYATADIAEMKHGASGIANGELIVYHQAPYQASRLLRINPDGTETVLVTYTDDADVPSVSIARMRQVLADARAHSNPEASMGLILWSHASGWLSESGCIDEPDEPAPAVDPQSFGADGLHSPKKMKIASLAKALEGRSFDFIYFDCCHMATVEVAYELRRLTPVIAACPTELGVTGMPYDATLRHFFGPTPRLDRAIQATFDHYYQAVLPGCAITLIATEPLDRLAELSRRVLAECPDATDYEPVPYFRTSVIPTGMFDMYHYYSARAASAPELLSRWQQAFREVVTEFHTTSMVYDLPATDFHGLASHILSDARPATDYGYDLTAWYADVVAPDRHRPHDSSTTHR